MKKETQTRSSKRLGDLEPRRSDTVRGGRLSLKASSVKVAPKADLLGKKAPVVIKAELVGPMFKRY